MPTLPTKNPEKRSIFIEALGWYGVIVVVLAYAAISMSLLSAQGFWYQFFNFTGSAGVAIQTYYRRDMQPFWLNLVWALIALVALISIVRLHI
jgi:hypothetical protein